MNMPLNFGQKVEEKSFDNDVIPKDTLLWCVINVRGIKNSKETNGRYLDIELTVADNQPYNRRKIWDKIADPFDANNSEEWRNMGYGAIRRILEAVKGASPDNPNSYVLNRLEELGGLTVPVLIGIEKGSAQYPDDKNRVDYLSPHSSVKKIVECYGLLMQGVFKYEKGEKKDDGQGSLLAGTQQAAPPAAMPPASAPPPAAAAAPQAAPGWLAPQGGAPAPAAAPAPNTGFPSGQAPAPDQQGHQAPPAGTATYAPPTGAPTAHQSAPNATASPSSGYVAPAGFQPQGQQGQ